MKKTFSALQYKGKNVVSGEHYSSNTVYFSKIKPPHFDMKIIGLMRQMANAIENKTGFNFWK